MRSSALLIPLLLVITTSSAEAAKKVPPASGRSDDICRLFLSIVGREPSKWIAYRISPAVNTPMLVEFSRDQKNQVVLYRANYDLPNTTEKQTYTLGLKKTTYPDREIQFFNLHENPWGPDTEVFSSDGKLLAFSKGRTPEVHLQNLDGSTRTLEFASLSSKSPSRRMAADGLKDLPPEQQLQAFIFGTGSMGLLRSAEETKIQLEFSPDNNLLLGWNAYGLEVHDVEIGNVVFRMSFGRNHMETVGWTGSEVLILSVSGEVIWVNPQNSESRLSHLPELRADLYAGAVTKYRGQSVLVVPHQLESNVLRVLNASTLQEIGAFFYKDKDGILTFYADKDYGRLVIVSHEENILFLNLENALSRESNSTEPR